MEKENYNYMITPSAKDFQGEKVLVKWITDAGAGKGVSAVANLWILTRPICPDDLTSCG